MAMFKQIKKKQQQNDRQVMDFVERYQTYLKGHRYIEKWEGKRDLKEDRLVLAKIEQALDVVWKVMGDKKREAVFEILVDMGVLNKRLHGGKDMFKGRVVFK